MKISWFLRSFLFFMVIFTVSSCKLFDDENPIPSSANHYLVSYNQVASYVLSEAKTVLQVVEASYPQAMTLGLSQKAKYGFWVYKVNYKTVFKNNDVVASGLVCVPMNSGPLPVISFQNGTNTQNAKAPSVNYNDNLFKLIECVSSMGYVVAMPDYLGFGASKDMFHPYLEKTTTTGSVTDLLRAVKEMASAKYLNFTLSKDTYLMGYSQGGWATLALTYEMESRLSQEFNLKASSCGAGPYDLTFVSKTVLGQQTYPQPYFMAYMVNSYIQYGSITNGYGDIFNSPYAGTGYISGLFDGTKDPATINSKLSETISQLFTQDFRAGFETGEKYNTLRAALASNSILAWKTTKPILMVHGQNDSLVTPLVSTKIYSDFQALGVSPALVNLVPVPGADHDGAVITWGLLSLDWIFKH